MEFYTLGRSGLRVSRLALGTMTFGAKWSWSVDAGTSEAIFDAYVEGGGNFIDTADHYTNGESETLCGRFIAERGLRDRMVLATKFTLNSDPANPNAGGNGRKNALRAIQASLRRLQTDYVDVLYLHLWDRMTPVEEVMRTLDDIVRSGMARYVGFSDVPGWWAGKAQAVAQLRSQTPAIALQLQYSLAERSIEDEFVDAGLDGGMGIVAWGALASGLLSGKYRQGAAGPEGVGRFASSPLQPVGQILPRHWETLGVLHDIAERLGRSMAQVAYNWTANQPGVGAIMLGASRPEQMSEGLGCLDFEIAPADLARLNAVSATPKRFPYSFFDPRLQSLHRGAAPLGDKPPGYAPTLKLT